jgi:hypothetical protein
LDTYVMVQSYQDPLVHLDSGVFTLVTKSWNR